MYLSLRIGQNEPTGASIVKKTSRRFPENTWRKWYLELGRKSPRPESGLQKGKMCYNYPSVLCLLNYGKKTGNNR